ncbi:MAG TPA: carbon monoxide dehydrogenase subunit G [Dehalococcoidia bacterium]
MHISGERRLAAPPEKVWQAMHDVAVLRETVPGCQELEQTAPDTFTGSAVVGVAVIKGLYRGTVRLIEEREASFLRVTVAAQSGHAEIRGEGSLDFQANDEGTIVRYEGEAYISGPLAPVGQRLLPAASKLLTQQFFDNIDMKLRGPGEQKGR